METNKNSNQNPQAQKQSNTSSNMSSGSTQSNANQRGSSSSGSQNMQGRSNQRGTTGQGGLKDIQNKLSQFGSTAANKFNTMTTTQKAVVGGAVLALGAGWMAMSQKNKNKIKDQISSAASSAKDAMHNLNAKQQQDKTSGSSTNARVK